MCTLFANIYVLLTWGPHMVYHGTSYEVPIWFTMGPVMRSPYGLPWDQLWGAHMVYHGTSYEVPIWFTMGPVMRSPYGLPWDQLWGAHVVYHGTSYEVPIWFTMGPVIRSPYGLPWDQFCISYLHDQMWLVGCISTIKNNRLFQIEFYFPL